MRRRARTVRRTVREHNSGMESTIVVRRAQGGRKHNNKESERTQHREHDEKDNKRERASDLSYVELTMCDQAADHVCVPRQLKHWMN